jgi:serine protease Do
MMRRVASFALLVLIVAWAVQDHHPEPPRAEDPYARVVRILRPSVALVLVDVYGKNRRNASEDDQVYGSASIVRSTATRSLLLTDAHVIEDARSIQVRLDDGRTVAAKAIDTDQEHDVAYLMVDVPNLPPVHFDASPTLEVGDPVGVAGYPIPDAFEDLHLNIALSVYSGRIASIRNTSLEVDAPVIPGESGGPVFRATDGSVVGIAEARIDDEKAIGFATPVTLLQAFLNKSEPEFEQVTLPASQTALPVSTSSPKVS